MKTNKRKKQFPVFTSDEEAEKFVETADLSEYDFSGFKNVHFEFAPKSKAISVRLPEKLHEAVKARAKHEDMKTQQFIRRALEDAVAS